MLTLATKLILATMLVVLVLNAAKHISHDLETISAHQRVQNAQIGCVLSPNCQL